jgi:large subunit ribosomal protein L15
LIKRLPRRRGFTNIFRVAYWPVNLRDLDKLDAGVEVTPELLKEKGLVRNLNRPVKVLGVGELGKPLAVKAHKFSATARQKIESAGGSATELGDGVGD